ncbi:MAG: TolC family protein [Candidatus Eisenbacteria bacterium]
MSRRQLPRFLSQFAPVLLAAPLALSACAHGMTGVSGVAATSPRPETPWTAPPTSRPAPRDESKPALPPELLATSAHWTLGDLVDIALRNSSTTRAAWEQARAAAARLGSARGAYFPQVDASASYSTQRAASFSDRVQSEERRYGGSLGLDWLLLIFGGRHADIAAAKQALIAADWAHNAAIQRVILEVERGYYDYRAAEALRLAEESSLNEAKRSLDAAEARHEAGLATIADVLQAKTAVAQAQLALDTANGRIQTTRGTLATAVGLPADTPYELQLDEETPAVVEIEESVEAFLERAREARPELAAARADLERARAEVRKTKAEGYPELRARGSVGRLYPDSPDRGQSTHAGSIGLSLPLFTGFAHHYDVREAEASARAAAARAEGTEQAVVMDVWTAYFNLKTAAQRLRTTDELLESATQSHEVAQGRYQSGVGSILDLLNAQTALENARAVSVGARADWFIAVAELSYAAGTLAPPASAPSSRAPNEEKP